MRYKIYFGNSPLYLTNEIDEEMTAIMHHDDGVYMDELSNPGVKSMIHEMKNPQHHAGVFYHADIDKLFREFRKHFHLITAGGGVVRNDRKEILMIFRKGKWDLPKGKLDKGEKIEDCALREVEEETGVKGTRLESPLTITYHVYDEFGKHILKETHWFNMKSPGVQALVPQEEEQITGLEWASEERITEMLKNSYPLIKDLLI
ncbi:MAG TPA: NUDIX domain-containing protein [Chitinophagaceae bacterium]|nr:NUDIX domain-containing protein [Chitinophagaceae bacterium]